MWSEPSWLFVFALETEDDLKTIAAHSGGFKAQILATVPELSEHEFIMLRRRPRSERLAVVLRGDGRLERVSSGWAFAHLCRIRGGIPVHGGGSFRTCAVPAVVRRRAAAAGAGNVPD